MWNSAIAVLQIAPITNNFHWFFRMQHQQSLHKYRLLHWGEKHFHSIHVPSSRLLLRAKTRKQCCQSKSSWANCMYASHWCSVLPRCMWRLCLCIVMARLSGMAVTQYTAADNSQSTSRTWRTKAVTHNWACGHKERECMEPLSDLVLMSTRANWRQCYCIWPITIHRVHSSGSVLPHILKRIYDNVLIPRLCSQCKSSCLHVFLFLSMSVIN